MTSTPEDIELPEAAQSSAGPSVSSLKATTGQVVVDENHPFDLDAYLSSYTGRTAYMRAVFIAQRCPSLAPQAYQTALGHLVQASDVQSYVTVLSAYNSLPGAAQIPQDQEYVDKTLANNAKEKDRLEVDLKTYAANMIKESVRLSHRELGRYYYSTGYYLEQEPYIRDILDAYMGSKFKDVLLLMERYSARHLLDIHLAHHVPTLAQQIRNRALVLYFQPFATVHLERMAAAFGMELTDMEANIVKLIEEGLIKARIDSQNKILRAKDHDPRVELYNRAVASGLETEASTRKLLWRMKLLQADIVIRAPKGQRGEGRQDSLPSGLMGWDDLQ